jgi:hypothetical protein
MTDNTGGAAARAQAVNAAAAATLPMPAETWNRIRRALGTFPYVGMVPIPGFGQDVSLEDLAELLERIGPALQDGATRAVKEADEADRLRRVIQGGRAFLAELLPDAGGTGQ